MGRISLSLAVDGHCIYGGAWAINVEYPEGLMMISLPNSCWVSNGEKPVGTFKPFSERY